MSSAEQGGGGFVLGGVGVFCCYWGLVSRSGRILFLPAERAATDRTGVQDPTLSEQVKKSPEKLCSAIVAYIWASCFGRERSAEGEAFSWVATTSTVGLH